MINVKFIKTHEKAILPKRNNNSRSALRVDGDSGYDLFAVEDTLIPGSKVFPKTELGTIAMEDEDFECGDRIQVGSAVVPVGLQLADLQEGYWFRIEGRSGLGFKYGIQPHFGIIDNQYRGDLGVKLYNFGANDYQIKAGDKIAQIIFYPIVEAKMAFTDTISVTERGEKGFGSSGN